MEISVNRICITHKLCADNNVFNRKTQNCREGKTNIRCSKDFQFALRNLPVDDCGETFGKGLGPYEVPPCGEY